MRKIKRSIAILAVVVFLGTLQPKPARALSAVEEGFLIAGAALAAYVVFIIVGTAITNRNRACFPDDANTPLEPDSAQSDVHFGQHCTQGDGGLTVVCW